MKSSRPPMLVTDAEHRPSSMARKAFVICVVSLLLLATTTGATVGLWLYQIGAFSIEKSKIQALQNFQYQDNTVVFDRNGQKIGEFFDRYHVFVPYEQLPKHFIDALTSIEDKNFFEHRGIDAPSVARAALIRLRSGRFSQGGSTITQQLVRELFLSKQKTISRKALEIAMAVEVEQTIPKQKILEIYANIMFLGNGAYGIGAAAHRYFAKNVSELTPSETALIAGLFQSPSRFNPARHPERARRRQQQVINALQRNGKVSTEEAQQLKSAPLVYRQYKHMNSSTAPWFVDHVEEILEKLPNEAIHQARKNGLRIHTSLDLTLQKMAEEAIRSYDSVLDGLAARTAKVKDPSTSKLRHAKVEASILATDPNTGDILAMVGGRDYRRSKFNRTTSALRSPGSVFKPIVYTEALAKGLKWSDVIFVSPINIENYRPKNSKDDYLTETTMLRAFYRSMNSPTIEIAQQIGLGAIIERAKAMGIRSPIKEEFGSALGSSSVSMLDLARAYGTYPSGGILSELTPIQRVTSADGTVLWEAPKLADRQQRALNPQLAYLMTEGMRSVLSAGTGHTSSDLARHAAGKTGTSNDSADNWFCGFTPDLLAIVWVGTDEHMPILANVTGGSIALPIWDQFIRKSKSVKPPREFHRPDGILEASIHPLYGHKVQGGTKMYFFTSRPPAETESAFENIENSGSRGFRNAFSH